MQNTLDWNALPVVLEMSEVKNLLRLGTNNTYALAHRAGFPAVRVGRRILVPRDALRAWLENQAAAV